MNNNIEIFLPNFVLAKLGAKKNSAGGKHHVLLNKVLLPPQRSLAGLQSGSTGAPGVPSLTSNFVPVRGSKTPMIFNKKVNDKSKTIPLNTPNTLGHIRHFPAATKE
jgi:hypothetical protein